MKRNIVTCDRCKKDVDLDRIREQDEPKRHSFAVSGLFKWDGDLCQQCMGQVAQTMEDCITQKKPDLIQQMPDGSFKRL